MFLEIFTFLGCAKQMKEHLKYSNCWVQGFARMLVLCIVIILPILVVFSVSITASIILASEGALYNAEYYTGNFGYSTNLLCYVYYLFMFLYPVGIFRPGRFAAFAAGLSCCCGFLIRDDEMRCGCLVASEDNAEACDCPINYFGQIGGLSIIIFF